MSDDATRVAIIGCGLIGSKRAQAVRGEDEIVGCFDAVPHAAKMLAAATGSHACSSLEELLGLGPDVVVVATPHDHLAGLALRVLESGADVLIEKPAALSTSQVDELSDAARTHGRLVKVGFNHRFYPGIERLVEEVRSGKYGDVLHVRANYGHGGRAGYDREWRADPARSGGGELIDQGVHLLDLTHWIAGPLPFHSGLLRTQFWDTAVEDNAALLLGDADDRTAPWATLHVSWTEWKNTFSFQVYCRTAKLQVDGLVRSYGPQTLRIYRMRPELGPPDLEEQAYADEDVSWQAEWRNLVAARANEAELIGTLADARYAWSVIEAAYAANCAYARMRKMVAR